MRPSPSRGFTLVELLVALFVLSLVAILSWRGLDGMTRAQSATQERADQVLSLQVGLAQWQADLDALVQLPQVGALDWNGRVLRITRRASPGAGQGVVVAAWSQRVVNGQGWWLRWQSPLATDRAQVQEAWQRADLWSQSAVEAEREREVQVVPLAQWQLFYFRGNTWSHPLSSDERTGASRAPGTVTPATGLVPDGIRLELTLPPGQPVTGLITSDWISPQVAAGKS